MPSLKELCIKFIAKTIIIRNEQLKLRLSSNLTAKELCRHMFYSAILASRMDGTLPLALQFAICDAVKDYLEQYLITQFNFSFILTNDPSAETCLVAVEHDGMNLRFIKRQTKSLCRAAVEQNCDAFRYVQVRQHTHSLTSIQS